MRRTQHHPRQPRIRAVLTIIVLAVVVVLAVCTSALAGVPGPGWEVTSTIYPTNIAPAGGTGVIEINVHNIGAQSSTGTVTVTDVLPEGLIATQAGDVQTAFPLSIEGLWECSFPNGKIVTCINSPALPSLPIPQPQRKEPLNQNESPPSVRGGGAIEHIGIAVKTETSNPGTLTNRVTVAGGGAPASASTTAPITVSSTPAPFGFQDFDGWFNNPDGTIDTQAGSHPYAVTFSLDLHTILNQAQANLEPAGGEPREISVNLPPGFVGNPTAVPECTRQQFEEEVCPPSTQVGIDKADALGGQLVSNRFPFPVYNLVPPSGVPAQFAFQIFGVVVFLDAGVRSGSNYGITAHVNNIPQKLVMGNNITLWGEPSDPSHDEDRFTKLNGTTNPPLCLWGCKSSAPQVPFLTLPTACEGPQEYTTSATAWRTTGSGEASFKSHNSNDISTGFTGCDHLGFDPTISVRPDTSQTDTPAGLTVDVRVPQEGLVTPGAIATSNIKDTTVVLPQGVVVNPGQATGLAACQPGQDGLTTTTEKAEHKENNGPAECPEASKVGEDEIETPLLSKPIKGNVYVLQSNPPELKLLVTASGEGVNIKLVGTVHLNETTGQLSTTFTETPELPFTDFKLVFSGGARAALDTPTQCGEQQATSDFTPWSTPAVPDTFPSAYLSIDSGSGGSNCPPSPLPFAPTMTAGSTTSQAGGFTNFSLLLQRPDDQQRISGLQFKMPPGLSGELSHIPLCTNQQAETNTCPQASKIGHTTVESGPGPYPLVVPEPGQEPAAMYLTETYEGAPFGLSIVVPLHVGPFVLPTQRVRARIEVDPRTAQLTVTTNPLPQEVAGVPTDLREIDAIVDHPEFIINPTNCNPSSFTGTASGTPPPGSGSSNTTATISSPFQMGSCRSLGFTPNFVAKSQGKTSKAFGASLSATLSYPTTPPGTGQATAQANIHSVKVELPKQLPSRLTTLQKACTAAQFNLNPAGCPPASIVGQALVHTPVLPVPLTGPAYFVSHGGEAFPALVLVLQGYGINIIVEATTFISKKGVTSLTFKTAPDAPFTTFTLTSPEGKNSALAANGNLCTSKLTMPTELVAQNGAILHQTTKVSVTGCPKAKAATRAQKLAAALKACHKNKNKTKRQTCEKQAHKKYEPTNTKKKPAKSKKK